MGAPVYRHQYSLGLDVSVPRELAEIRATLGLGLWDDIAAAARERGLSGEAVTAGSTPQRASRRPLRRDGAIVPAATRRGADLLATAPRHRHQWRASSDMVQIVACTVGNSWCLSRPPAILPRDIGWRVRNPGLLGGEAAGFVADEAGGPSQRDNRCGGEHRMSGRSPVTNGRLVRRKGRQKGAKVRDSCRHDP